MAYTIIFDTETTGLPAVWNAPYQDIHNWPRMVSIAWGIFDDTGCCYGEYAHLVIPEGYEIPPQATAIHGITTNEARKSGIPIPVLSDLIGIQFSSARTIVAHNLQFDWGVLCAELHRIDRPDIIGMLERKRHRCTKELGTYFCKIPAPAAYKKQWGNTPYKWPTLDELHTALFGEPVEDAHNALHDMRAAAACYFELIRQGFIQA